MIWLIASSMVLVMFCAISARRSFALMLPAMCFGLLGGVGLAAIFLSYRDGFFLGQYVEDKTMLALSGIIATTVALVGLLCVLLIWLIRQLRAKHSCDP